MADAAQEPGAEMLRTVDEVLRKIDRTLREETANLGRLRANLAPRWARPILLLAGSAVLALGTASLVWFNITPNPVCPPRATGPSRPALRLAAHGGAAPIAASFPAPGSAADAMTFAGTELWTTDNSDAIYQADVNGQVDASYTSPDPTPEGITWDGHSFWVFTTSGGPIDHFRIRSGQVRKLGAINPNPQIIGTENLAWEHGKIWWADQSNVRLLSTNGTVVRVIPKAHEVLGLAWDGRHLWLGYDNFPDGSRIEEDTASGAPIRTFVVPVTALTSLAWGAGTLWAMGQNNPGGGPIRIYRLNLPSAQQGTPGAAARASSSPCAP